MQKALNRPLPHEDTTVLAAGVAQTITVRGERIPGLLAVRHRYFSYDDTTVTDLRVKVIPRTAQGAVGGDVFHTVRAVPTPQSNNRHMLPLMIDLEPGEDVAVTLSSAAGGTIRWRLEREGIFEDATPVDIRRG